MSPKDVRKAVSTDHTAYQVACVFVLKSVTQIEKKRGFHSCHDVPIKNWGEGESVSTIVGNQMAAISNQHRLMHVTMPDLSVHRVEESFNCSGFSVCASLCQ